MSTRYSRIKEIKDWVRWNTHTADELADVEGIAPEIRESLKSVEERNWLFYDERTRILKIKDVELVHTQSADRIACIEGIQKGMSLNYKTVGEDMIITSSRGSEVGNVPGHVSSYVFPLIQNDDVESISIHAGEVIPRSMRGKGAKKAICNVEFEIRIKAIERSKTKAIVCLLGGDQINLWVQKLEVKYLDIPANDVKLMFEIYNRQLGEYDPEKNDVGYAGLDNLTDEITAARNKMRAEKIAGLDYSQFSSNGDAGYYLDSLKQIVKKETSRYGHLLKYFTSDQLMNGYVPFKEAFDNHVLDEEMYYWVEQTRVNEEEYNAAAGDWQHHYYEILEAFEGTSLPVDLKDPDVVSIFGTGKFIAFADLSYGC